MAYPTPIPPLTRNESKEFLDRLHNFRLSKKQAKFWKADTENEPFDWNEK